MKPAIIVSANTASVAVVRALGTMGVPVVMMHYSDSDDIAHVSKYVRERIKVPHPEAAEKQFVDRVIDCARQYAGALLIPTADESVLVVAKHKELLARHYIVACTEQSITEQFVDKKHTYALAEKLGVPFPKMIVPKSLEDVERYGRSVDYPCLMKPCHSHRFHAVFRQKVFVIQNPEELVFRYRKVEEAGLEVMLQEIIPGNDTHGVNYNSYSWNGEPLVEFTSAKLRHAWPRFGFPCAVVSKDIPEVKEFSRALLKGMGFYGFGNVEFKRDPRDGVYKLMEVNGRHNLSSMLAVRCGINFPWLQYRHLVEGELPRPSRAQEGVYWLDPFKDIGYGIKYFREEQYTIGGLLRPYFKPHVFATLDFTDPKPTMWRVKHLLARVTKRRIRGTFTAVSKPRQTYRRLKRTIVGRARP